MVKQKKLLLRCADDSVIIMAFVLDDGHTVKKDGTKAEIDAEIQRASVSFPQERMPVIGWEEIIDSDMPERTFRDAWITKGNKKIEHDMSKARNIHKERLRIKRAPVLEILDVEYQRADETSDNNKKKDIAQRKQKLRDITDDPRIEQATNIEELKALTFEELTK